MLPKITDLLLSKGQKIGVITNYSTEEFLKRDFVTKKMNLGEYVELVHQEQIEVIFIERDIYEIDHQWYGLKLEEIIESIKKLNVNIVIVDNTLDNESIEDYPCIFMKEDREDIQLQNYKLHMPYMLNEKLLNPTKVKKNIDLIAIKFIEFNSEFKTMLKIADLKQETISLLEMKRGNIKKIISKMKSSKVIYVPFSKEMDFRLLSYLEKAAVLQNTVMVIDPEYPFDMKYALKSLDQTTTMHLIQTYTNDGLYLDKKVISDSRKVFLTNTLIQYESFDNVLQGITDKQEIKVSVITSTKRKWTLPEYIDRLNKQSNVTIEVILLTHGFELDDMEKNDLKEKADFELKVISEGQGTVFGTCLNKCIDLTSYEFFTKVDDDDYYYPNYLIDSWIAKQFSEADIVGKYSQFVYLESANMTIQRFGHLQNRYSKYVAGATIFCETEFVKKFMFSEKSKAVDSDIIRRVLEQQGTLYCTHPYEFCIFRAENKEEHTWQIPDVTLLRSADVLFYNNPHETLTIM